MDAFASVDSQVSKAHKQNDTQRDWQAWRSAGAGKPRASADAAGAAVDEDKVKSGSRGGDKKRPAPAPSPSTAEEDAEAEEADSDRWVPLQEPGTGESYWFNVATGATRREPPGAVLDGGGSSSSSASAVGGRGAKRQAINPILQAQAALERHLASAASSLGVAATGAAGRSVQHVAAAAAAERADAWVESVDPLSRYTYYTNRVSGETRWERPAVLDPAAASPAAAAPAARAAPGAATASAPASAAAAQAPQPARKLTWTRGIEGGKPFWMCRENGETRFSKPPP
jgi:hypothetical protein